MGLHLHRPWFRKSKKQRSNNVSGIPSTAEYALEGVKVSLELLQKAADFVPFPYVRPALDAAITLITIGEDMQSTIERAVDLNRRVWALMLVMIEPLKGKLAQDIPQELKSDIEQLTIDLQSIEGVLRGIAAQNRLLLVLFKKLNEEKVEECLDQLDESLSKFHVSREINNVILTWEMATGMKAAYGLAEESLKVTQQGLEVAKAGLDVATGTFSVAHANHYLSKETMGIANKGFHIAQDGLGVAKESLKITTRVADQVDEMHNVFRQHIHRASTLPSREMPTKPHFFYGRDNVVDTIASLLTTTERPRVAILGPGGMGKTSVALAVMEHPAVASKFGEKRFWVPCVEGRSPNRFLEILVSCLRISHDTGDLLSDILYELRASLDPRTILLDNFETPWYLDNHRAEIARILCALANIPHVALLITMRSNYPPCEEEIAWSIQNLTFLDIHEARRVYIAIHPDAESNLALDELLKELGYMPLAVTLMAKLGKKSGDMPDTLLRTWRRENVRTNMLDSGSDSERSINRSIDLSIHSSPMAANPEASLLLSTLSMFPAGTQRKHLEQWAPSISNISGALATLSDTSLIDQSDRFIYVHPVIRSYMVHPQRLSPSVKADVRQSICQFIISRKSEPGDDTFVRDVQDLANEETNIQSIMTDVIKDGFDAKAVEALLAFCWYQHWTRPSVEIIKAVLLISRSAKHEEYIGESLFCLGHIYFKLNHYDKAHTALMEARDMFQITGNRIKAAQCLLKLSDVNQCLYNIEGSRETIENAQQELAEIGDLRGISDGLLCLGEHYWINGSTANAVELFKQALGNYSKIHNAIGVADCTYWLSANNHAIGNYDEAKKGAEAALAEYERLDDRVNVSDCLRRLCSILKDMGCFDEALAGLVRGLDLAHAIGSPLRIALYLETFGEVYTRMERYDQASAAYEKAVEMFRLRGITNPLGTAAASATLVCLSKVYQLQSRPGDAATALNMAYQEYQSIGINQLSSMTAMARANISNAKENGRQLHGLLFDGVNINELESISMMMEQELADAKMHDRPHRLFMYSIV